jgi:hypothetical protein
MDPQIRDLIRHITNVLNDPSFGRVYYNISTQKIMMPRRAHRMPLVDDDFRFVADEDDWELFEEIQSILHRGTEEEEEGEDLSSEFESLVTFQPPWGWYRG